MCTEDSALKYHARRKVNRQLINFYVYFDVDEQEAAHTLSLDNYYREGTHQQVPSSAGSPGEGVSVSRKRVRLPLKND